MFYYLSFADPNKPKGTQFLGACIVKSPNFMLAVQGAWNFKCNPGGECKGAELPAQFNKLYEKYQNKLMQVDEIKEFDKETRILSGEQDVNEGEVVQFI